MVKDLCSCHKSKKDDKIIETETFNRPKINSKNNVFDSFLTEKLHQHEFEGNLKRKSDKNISTPKIQQSLVEKINRIKIDNESYENEFKKNVENKKVEIDKLDLKDEFNKTSDFIPEKYIKETNLIKNEDLDNNYASSLKISETYKVTLKKGDDIQKILSKKELSSLIENSDSFFKEFSFDKPIVKKNEKVFEGSLIYKMNSLPRGYCLIINNATSKSHCLSLKNGFKAEALYLRDLFTQLDFNVSYFENQKSSSMLKLMKALSKEEALSKHDAFACILLAHGNSDYIMGVDNFFVNLELLIGCMNNYHCPRLIGKPKIFILHTCQSTCQQFPASIPPSEAVPREINILKNINNYKIIPTWTDTLVIYFALDLNKNCTESNFVKEFGKLLCESSCEKPLKKILFELNFNLLNHHDNYSSEGVDFIYKGCNKNFYFNPGHHKLTDKKTQNNDKLKTT